MSTATGREEVPRRVFLKLTHGPKMEVCQSEGSTSASSGSFRLSRFFLLAYSTHLVAVPIGRV